MLRGATVLLYSLLFCPSSAASGQIRIEKLSLIDTSMNELYIGIPNKLFIAGLREDDHVFLDEVSVSDGSGAVVHVIPDPGVRVDTLFVKRADSIVFAQPFLVKRIPDAELFLGAFRIGYDVGKARVSDLVDAMEIIIRTGNLQSRFSVVSFSLSMLLKGQYCDLGKTSGDTFSPDQRLAISRLRAGDRLYIDNIRVQGFEHTRQCNSISLQIVE